MKAYIFVPITCGEGEVHSLKQADGKAPKARPKEAISQSSENAEPGPLVPLESALRARLGSRWPAAQFLTQSLLVWC